MLFEDTEGLTDFQKEIVANVREFVDKEVIPVADKLEHTDTFPDKIVEQMKEMGIFALTVPEEYGGLGEGLLTYVLVVMELSRGWMSLAGIINTNFIDVYLINTHGTKEQKERFLPRIAAGEIRGAFSMSEPGAGSDVAAIKTKARREGDYYIIDGEKMWVTNGLRAGFVATLVKTDPNADPPHRGMSVFLVEKEPGVEKQDGLTVTPNIDKMGYKGVETTALIFDNYKCPAENLLGGEEGKGFYQMMDSIEVGRVNVAGRAVGLGMRAFEEAIKYAQQREAFGKPIAEHQAIAHKLADMATQLAAARALTINAARKKDAGGRADLEAGMAKLFASEACHSIVTEALRIHGGYGYSKEFTIERLYRDAPFLLIGEGTSEIQKNIISRQLLKRYKIDV